MTKEVVSKSLIKSLRDELFLETVPLKMLRFFSLTQKMSANEKNNRITPQTKSGFVPQTKVFHHKRPHFFIPTDHQYSAK